MRVSPFVLSLVGLVVFACNNNKSNGDIFATTGGGGTVTHGGSAPTAGGAPPGDDSSLGGGSPIGQGGGIVIQQGGAAGFSAATCTNGGGDVDQDNDGWTPNQGDCNDCDPLVNPGALDVVNFTKDMNGMATTTPLDDADQIDEDCDGHATLPSDPKVTCDDDITATEVTDPFAAARAMGLCNVMVDPAPADLHNRKWGVTAAAFSTIAGAPLQSPLDDASRAIGLGILPDFGDATHPQEGVRMFALSSGVARAPGQDGYITFDCEDNVSICHTSSSGKCGGLGNGHSDQDPPGFPKAGTCGQNIAGLHDGVALDLQIRVPTNATSMSVKFRFFSCEFPEFACGTYNDAFALLMAPSPFAAANSMTDKMNASADIAFESTGNTATPYNVIGVNNQSFLTACEKGAAKGYNACVGDGDLSKSGFDGHGGSAWLESSVPVNPKANGGVIFLRFAIWDSSDELLDSTVMVDDIEFSAEEGTTAVQTVIVPSPE